MRRYHLHRTPFSITIHSFHVLDLHVFTCTFTSWCVCVALRTAHLICVYTSRSTRALLDRYVAGPPVPLRSPHCVHRSTPRRKVIVIEPRFAIYRFHTIRSMKARSRRNHTRRPGEMMENATRLITLHTPHTFRSSVTERLILRCHVTFGK